jgi:MFS family permease
VFPVCRLPEIIHSIEMSMVRELDRDAVARRTFRCELFASPSGGVLEAGFSTFVILLAIRDYGASEYEKAVLAASMSAGLLVAPLGLSLMRATRYPVNWIACALMLLTGICLLVVFVTNSLTAYVVGLAVAQISIAQQYTLRLHIHANNYRSSERGRRLSWILILGAFSCMGCSYVFGWFLDNHWEHRDWIFAFMVLASIGCAMALVRIPSSKLPDDDQDGTLASFRLVWSDKLFAVILLGWMLLGLGWLTTVPLRIEYLASSESLNLSNSEIALLTLVIPSLAKILSLRLFGDLFDRSNFVPFRIVLNFFLIASVLLFFHSTSFPALCLASIFTGIAFGGSSIAWSLWVTRVAPPGKEAAYMSAHVALTGVRGLIAPFWCYYLLTKTSFSSVACISAGFLILSTICFLGIWSHKRLKLSMVST